VLRALRTHVAMKRRTYVVECESQQLDSKSLQLINGMGMNYGHILTLQYCLKIVYLKFFFGGRGRRLMGLVDLVV